MVVSLCSESCETTDSGAGHREKNFSLDSFINNDKRDGLMADDDLANSTLKETTAVKKDNVDFCSICRGEIDPWTVVCPKCGFAQCRLKPDEKVSRMWYLLPFLFGFIGGIVAWSALKDRNCPMAQNMLIIGIIWTELVVLFFGAKFLEIIVPMIK
jgi:hypothetical protein